MEHSAAIRIRPFRPTDLPKLQELTAAAFAGVSIDHGIEQRFGRIKGRDWRWRKVRHVAEDADRDESGILVAESGPGEIAGYVSTWCDAAAGIGHIPNLVVAEGMRGRGIGRSLLHAACERFRSLGLTHAKIETLVQNETGRGLYETLGFREVARQIHFVKSLDDEFNSSAPGAETPR